ncbi:hypothetical protein VCHA53O466_40470 [Vibrio chagasii]|nr:hypothetical protein VCHA53O466_40470 [Vibrio chagasii]
MHNMKELINHHFNAIPLVASKTQFSRLKLVNDVDVIISFGKDLLVQIYDGTESSVFSRDIIGEINFKFRLDHTESLGYYNNVSFHCVAQEMNPIRMDNLQCGNELMSVRKKEGDKDFIYRLNQQATATQAMAAIYEYILDNMESCQKSVKVLLEDKA